MTKRLLLSLALAFCAGTAQAQVDVLTSRYDNSRTGQNLNETTLTLSNVNSATFGKLYSFVVDGYVYGQPLYKSNVSIPGKGIHNVIYIVTMHDSIYALDADTATPLWQVRLVNLTAGITTEATADSGVTDIIPEIGIISTPVIDGTSGTMYVVAKTKENGVQFFRLHALDITTGADKVPPVAVTATVPGTGTSSVGGVLTMNPNWHWQRPGLALVNGVVYIGIGAQGDFFPWHGWLVGYNATNLTQVSVFCTTPNGVGGGVWVPGEAPPVDAAGNIFINTGNGDFNGSSDYGDSIIKLSTASNLSVLDFFAPFNQAALSTADLDISSAGIVLLPDSSGTTAHPHLLVTGGKDGTIYVLDRDSMGGFNGSYTKPDSQIVQEIWNAVGGITTNPTAIPLAYVENNYITPGFWQNHLYWCATNDFCKMFNFSNGLLTTTPASKVATTYGPRGAQPVITAASPTATSGIMWAVETAASSLLHAYNATNLATELYNGNQAANNRDQGGLPVKFATPTIVNGKVFVGAQGQVDVYGLLASNPARLAAPVITPPQGTYGPAQTVSITDADSSAQIFYTLDGSIPTVSSTLYTGPFAVSVNTTVNAIAVRTGFLTSPVTTAVYTIGTLVTTGGFVQGNFATPHGSITSVNVPFTGFQGPGDLNLVVVGWNDTNTTVTSVNDTMGNAYTLAVGPTLQSVAGTQSIYYAKNIAPAGANANSVTINFSGGGAHDPDVRIAEYSGLDTINPLDAKAAAQGSSATSDSGSGTTTSATELIVGANLVQTGTTGPGTGFINRMITVPDADILEDQVVTATGSYNATAPLNPAGQWIMQMVTFKAAPTNTIPPTAPSNLTATPVAPNRINLAWTASSSPAGIALYTIERCPGISCTNFSQLGTVNGSTTTFSDSGTYPFSTPYTYRVWATDGSGLTSGYSNTASATAPPDTTPPTTPTNLVATAISNTQINLTWTASTDDVGVTGYLLERCQGAGCTSFAQISTPLANSWNDTGLLASTAYSYRVRATDSVANLSGYSNVASATTLAAPPPTPTIASLSPTSGVIGTSVTITGTNFGGALGTVTFAGVAAIPTTWTPTSIVAPVPGGATTGNVVVTAGSVASNGVNFTVIPSLIKLVQHTSKDAGTTRSSTQAFASNNTAGNWIAVVIRAGRSGQNFTVTDSRLNTYHQAFQFNVTVDPPNGDTFGIFYAENIAGGANTITVQQSISGTMRFAILEYSGVAASNSLDGTAAQQGTSANPGSGNVTTTANGDLLLGAIMSGNGETFTAGSGYTIEERVPAAPNTKLIAEDAFQSTAGSTSASAGSGVTDNWGAGLAAFKMAAATATPTAPTSLTAAAAGPVQINLSWTASTEAGGTISQYLVERCAGANCGNTSSNFAQVGTSATTSFSDTTGLLGSTTYNYRVRAMDTTNNTGPYSNVAAATTAAPTFTAPSNLTGTAAGPVQVNLSWTAATETGGTLSQYLVERCAGAACSNFAQVGTSVATSFSDTTGLLGSTTYNYRVRATDAANNLGPYSNIAAATTAAATFTAPSNLTATAAGSTQINLSWTAATETGGTISNYLIERCQSSGCSNFAQVATSATTTFSDTGLLAGTTYSYRVRATDAANNTSPYSNTASATTLTTLPPPITFVQVNSATPQSPQTTVTVPFTAAQTAGNLNVVVVGWNDSTAAVSTIMDTKGNVYTPAVGPTVQTGVATQSIYFAKNIAAATANGNSVTVTFTTGANFPDIRIAEYSGLDTASPLDVSLGAQGNSATTSSGAVTTTNANDLLIGANLIQTGTTGAGSGFTSRIITPQDADILEDRIVTATGSYTATAPISPSAQWIMQIVAFKRHP